MRHSSWALLVGVTVLLGVCVSPAGAITQDYFLLGSAAKLPDRVYISPQTYTGIQLDGPFGEINDGTGWVVTQWGQYDPLTEIVNCQRNCGDGRWKIISADGSREFHVSAYNANTTGAVYRLGQNSYGLVNGADCGGNTEADLLAEPLANLAYPDFPAGFVPFPSRTTVGHMSALHVAADIAVHQSTHQVSTCSGPYASVNLHSTVMDLVLQDFDDDPMRVRNQDNTKDYTLFYQLIVGDSRSSSFDKYWFDHGGSNGSGTYGLGPWGVNDSIDQYSLPYPQVVNRSFISYDINVLGRLSDVITNNVYLPTSLRDPDKWTITGAYFGTYVNGEGRGDVRIRHPRIYDVR